MKFFDDIPGKVVLTEVGPRDGLQMERQILTTDEKIHLISALGQAGLRWIQAASFVHPEKVPQMNDAEAVIERLPDMDKINYSALTLNQKGVERACRTKIPWIEISLSGSQEHSRANSGMTVEQAMEQIKPMIMIARRAGRKVRGSIQCAFGYLDTDQISVDAVKRLTGLFLENAVDHLVLADTTGMGTPVSIRLVLEAVLPMAGAIPVCLHLHDTRGLGLVNLMIGLMMGVHNFDTSIGGLGGCPFAKAAAGNIATEDTVHMLNRLSVKTGVSIERLVDCSRQLSRLLGRPLPGKIYKLKQ
ncbi:MAG: hydroxymethylglutaryl-CoA lyase [Desulfobacteraceae bacterium]|nr:hydroxymethylglutaryl-CoA lyase [Desulfobacteraceae bacterium]